MKEYPHIDTIWKRDGSGRIVESDYSCPEFEFLENNKWIGTEKVDGTNIRVMWESTSVRFGGKTDNAQIPAFLIARLQDLFLPSLLRDKFGDSNVCLYGEGYGARIQKGGGNYKSDGVDFVLFDVKVGEWWLKRDAIEDIAATFAISVVPIVFSGSLAQACSLVQNGFDSCWGDFPAEGLVLKPAIDLLKRNGERVIAKIKQKDYSRK